MQKLEPRTRTEKSKRILGGLLLLVITPFLGVFGIVSLIAGLALIGNAVFAKTKDKTEQE